MTSSNLSKILLATFVCLCIVAVAAAVALGTGHHEDMDKTSSSREAHADIGGVHAGEDSTRPEGQIAAAKSGDSDLVMETSAIKLSTNKNVRKQVNRLARTRARAARAAESPAQEEPSSDADTAPNQNLQRRDLISCFSEKSNETIPAAHISGHGTKPFAHYSSGNLVKGYQQRWKCCEYSTSSSHNAAAFVDGGMIFNQTDKTLRVPTCGYYHITTQIYYQIDVESLADKTLSVTHLLRFKRNCPSWPEYNPVTIKAKSAVSKDDTTTHTSDVVRLCAGGKVWVEIPDFNSGVPCCPMGDEQGTFIAAHLIAETTCHWPPNTMMENLNV